MNTEKYNGWTNRETWLVNLHFDNFFYTHVSEWLYSEKENGNEAPTRQEIADYLKDLFEEYEEVIENQLSDMHLGGFISDFLDFSKIDWYDLAESFYEEQE